MKKRRLSFLRGLVLLLGGCSKPTPLQQLQSCQKDAALTPAFWVKVAIHPPYLWLNAARYGKDHLTKLNCSAAFDLNRFNPESPHKAPRLGHGGSPVEGSDFTGRLSAWIS